MAKHDAKRTRREITVDQFGGGRLIFVRRDGHTDAPFRDFPHQRFDPRIGPGTIGIVFRVIVHEIPPHPHDGLFVSRRFGQGAFDQPGNAVADEITVCRTFMRRIAVLLQRMVRSGSQIVDRIEQRPVKVEYNQFGIHENQIYPAKVAFCRELS